MLACRPVPALATTTGKSEKRRGSGARALLPVSDEGAAQQRSSAQDLYSTHIVLLYEFLHKKHHHLVGN